MDPVGLVRKAGEGRQSGEYQGLELPKEGDRNIRIRARKKKRKQGRGSDAKGSAPHLPFFRKSDGSPIKYTEEGHSQLKGGWAKALPWGCTTKAFKGKERDSIRITGARSKKGRGKGTEPTVLRNKKW